MGKAQSLTSLCLQALKDELLRGDDLLQVLHELPAHLFEILVLELPPLMLHKLQMSTHFEDRNDDNYDDFARGNGKKRGRSSSFDKAWRDLFQLRWPEELVSKIQSVDWLQIYWETHVQRCLDEAAEVAVLPHFDGFLGEIKISDISLKHITGHMKSFTSDYSKLSYNLQEFGLYARNLRLRSILCGPETSNLLRKSKLQSLILEWIRSKEQIDGLCKLLSQNCESLYSIEFSHCKFSSRSIDEICDSLTSNSKPVHWIQRFSISTSRFQDPNPVSLPSGLVSLLSSGRSLCSLKLCDNYLGQNFANMVFNALRDVSSGVYLLDLSENNISGWLSDYSPTSPKSGKSMLSLRVLNIRGNDLDENDAINLRHALVHMPKLEVLDISDNPLENGGIRSLLPYFTEASETGSSFAELHVENCELSDDGIIDLLNSLTVLKKPLKSLSIANNVVGRKVVIALGTFLSTSIMVLNISGIGLGSDGFQALQESIAEELKLVEINISRNRGGISVAKFLSAILSRSPRLVSVNAACNFMPIESICIISSALKTSKGNLEVLDLRENNLASAKADELDELRRIGPSILLLSSLQILDVLHDDEP